MSATTWLSIPILLAVSCCAQTPEETKKAIKPECNAQNRGKLWPEKTAHAVGVPIEICTAKAWKYRWQQLTVDISQLIAAARKPVAVTQAAEPRRGDSVTAP